MVREYFNTLPGAQTGPANQSLDKECDLICTISVDPERLSLNTLQIGSPPKKKIAETVNLPIYSRLLDFN
jgi:hypothetical protein